MQLLVPKIHHFESPLVFTKDWFGTAWRRRVQSQESWFNLARVGPPSEANPRPLKPRAMQQQDLVTRTEATECLLFKSCNLPWGIVWPEQSLCHWSHRSWACESNSAPAAPRHAKCCKKSTKFNPTPDKNVNWSCKAWFFVPWSILKLLESTQDVKAWSVQVVWTELQQIQGLSKDVPKNLELRWLELRDHENCQQQDCYGRLGRLLEHY